MQLITDANVEYEVVEYLKNTPSEQELTDILNMLGMEPEQLVRKGEAIYKENFKDKAYSKEEWIKILVNNPKLIERPIVVSGNKAILGRPPENVRALL